MRHNVFSVRGLFKQGAWLAAVLAVVLPAGCARYSEPVQTTETPTIQSDQPVAEPTATQAATPKGSLSDEFGLPLVIELDIPEAPAEVQGVSPPPDQWPQPAPSRSIWDLFSPAAEPDPPKEQPTP